MGMMTNGKQTIAGACRGRLLPAILGFGLFAISTAAQAEQMRVVVIGASNAAGYRPGSAAAWPALLEGMLRAKGYDVTVTVKAVVGATSAQVLAGADTAISDGTKLVIYDVGKGNDTDAGAGGQTAANAAAIAGKIRAHGAKAIYVQYGSIVGAEKTNPSMWIQGDPHHHITAAAHQRVAAWLLPKAMGALGRPK